MPPHSGSSIDWKNDIYFHLSRPFIIAFSAERDKTFGILNMNWFFLSTYSSAQSTSSNLWGMILLQKQHVGSYPGSFLLFILLILVFKKAAIVFLDGDVRLHYVSLETSAFYPKAHKSKNMITITLSISSPLLPDQYKREILSFAVYYLSSVRVLRWKTPVSDNLLFILSFFFVISLLCF